MNKQTKIKIVFGSIILLVVVLIFIVIALENEKDISSIERIAKANISAVNEETDPEVEAIMQLDASGDKVPVPEGYVGSKATGENEIDTGYVIYEGTEEVTDSNVEQAKTTRNQYVWIPVPDASKMYGTDSNGKKWGKLYNFATSSTNSNYDELTGAYPLNWSENNGIMEISNSTDKREPDVVTDMYESDMDSILKTFGLGAETTHEFLIQLEKEFNSMIESVEKYGGFYIGRYETGNLNKETVVVQKGNTDISDEYWYNIYKKCKELKGSNNKVETGIIWGSQWDRTLMWLVESENRTKEEIAEDSVSWGNYSNNSEAGAGSRKATGFSEIWKTANIYDLAGNMSEMTMEACFMIYRGYRGSNFYFNGTASDRSSYNPNASYNSYGCRAALYIK